MPDEVMSTEVSFYDLNVDAPLEKQRLACRLVIRAYDQEEPKNVFVRVVDESETEQLSSLLWQHSSDRFIPHTLGKVKPEFNNLIRIGAELPDDHHYLIIDLVNEAFPLGGKVDRVFHIVRLSERDASKALFDHYNKLHCMVQRHNIEVK